MKIAISAQGREMNSPVDPRFGRAAWLIIIDSDTRQIVDVIDNTAARDAAHGAGINAATVVAESGAEVVLTGRVGPKAFAVLDAAGIKVISDANGTVEETLNAFLSGGLTPDSAPTSDGHSSGPGAASFSQPAGGGGGRGRCGGGAGRGGGGGGRGQGRCGCRKQGS